MKHLLIATVIVLAGCENSAMINDPVKGSSNYEECLMDFHNSSYAGVVGMVANNFKFAKEIREDAKVCIANTAVGNGKTNKEDDIEACTVHAYSINGGVSPTAGVWDLGFNYRDAYADVVKCRQKFNVKDEL